MGVYPISQLCALPAKVKETSGSRGKGEAAWGVKWPTPEPDFPFSDLELYSKEPVRLMNTF